jgi:hypothetical protein
MKKAFLLLAVALLLIFLSGSVYNWGLDYDLRGLPAAELMSLLDTTMIGEKWKLIELGTMGSGVVLLILAGAAYHRDGKKVG